MHVIEGANIEWPAVEQDHRKAVRWSTFLVSNLEDRCANLMQGHDCLR